MNVLKIVKMDVMKKMEFVMDVKMIYFLAMIASQIAKEIV